MDPLPLTMIPLSASRLLCRLLAVLALCCRLGGGIRVVEVVVPEVVEVGQPVLLECRYEEEGDKLYTLKWWRGDDQFYQLVPPKRSYYPANGVSVNMSATERLNLRGTGTLEQVMLDPVGLDAAGVYKCEVIADSTFHTVSEQANMTVVYVPESPPRLFGLETGSIVKAGQRIELNCSVPPASPPPTITWLLNGREAPAEWSSSYPPRVGDSSGKPPVRVTSALAFSVPAWLLRQSDGRLSILCVASQQHSGYRQQDGITLHQETQTLSWLWSSGAASVSEGRFQLDALCWALVALLLLHRTV